MGGAVLSCSRARLGRGPGGLEPCPFQQKKESTLFCSVLYQKNGVSLTGKGMIPDIFHRFALRPPFSFLYHDKK